MDEFINYSKENRMKFLSIITSIYEEQMDFACYNEFPFFLKKLYTKYQEFLDIVLTEYNEKNNTAIEKETCICDFLSSMEEQIADTSFVTKDENLLHISCVIYNMIVNIHKYSYEIFSKNHSLNEKLYFHGDSLSYLLEMNETTVEKFRKESPYDIDSFNHITLPDDYKYLSESGMVDIYLLSLMSDITEIPLYNDFFNIVYVLNNKKILTPVEYRFFLTTEDVIKSKKSYLKPLLSLFFFVVILSSAIIFFIVSMM